MFRSKVEIMTRNMVKNYLLKTALFRQQHACQQFLSKTDNSETVGYKLFDYTRS